MDDFLLRSLRVHPASRDLSDEDRQVVAAAAEVREYAAGDAIIDAGEKVETLFLVVRGRVKLTAPGNPRSVVAILGHSEQFGMFPLAQGDPSPMDVVVEEPTIMVTIERSRALELFDQIPAFRIQLMQLAGGRLTDLALGRSRSTKRRLTGFVDIGNSGEALLRLLGQHLTTLGESLGVVTDAGSSTEFRHPHYELSGDSREAIRKELAEQLAIWEEADRIVFALGKKEGGPNPLHLQGLASTSEQVYWIATPETFQGVFANISDLLQMVPTWKRKFAVIWVLPNGSQVPPHVPQLNSFIDRSFVVSESELVSLGEERAGSTPVISQGIGRLVHHLRGVQIGLALGGGAARGMAHLGVLQALDDAGIAIDAIAGTSSGAMTGIVYAAGFTPEFAIDRFTHDLALKGLFATLPNGGKWYMLRKYRSGQWDGMLRNYFQDWRLEQMHLPVCAVTVDLVKAEQLVLDEGDCVRSILESINLPFLSAPICRDGKTLVDGGVLNTLPADVLADRGCNYVIASDVSTGLRQEFVGNRPESTTEEMKTPSIWQVWTRVLEVQNRRLSMLGARASDLTIAPAVASYDLDAFSQTPEIADIGRTTAVESMEQIRRDLNRIDPALFPLPTDR